LIFGSFLRQLLGTISLPGRLVTSHPQVYSVCYVPLTHEEHRKVQRTGHVSNYERSCRVPGRSIGQRVWTIVKEALLTMDCSRRAEPLTG
jgi:hypothetical protein